jgi:hypothetical protein
MKTPWLIAVFLAVLGLFSSHAAEPQERIAWNVVSGPTDQWVRAFASHVRNGDIVIIPEGNGGKPADVQKALGKYRQVSAKLKELAVKDVTYAIYTTDLGNVEVVAAGIKGEPGIAMLAYGYEPDFAREFPKASDLGWTWANALANVKKAKALAAAAGKKLMVIPTGRALLETDLQKYGWDYAGFLNPSGADVMLVQTQTWAMKGRFAEAIDKLAGQLKAGHADFSKVSLQVTVEPERISNKNGIDATTAYQAVLAGRERGFTTMSLWVAYRDLNSPLEFLGSLEKSLRSAAAR